MLTGLLAARPSWPGRVRWSARDSGLTVMLVTLSGRGDGSRAADRLLHLRIGTGEIVDPQAAATLGYGWWLALAGGAVLLVADLLRYVAVRPPSASGPAQR